MFWIFAAGHFSPDHLILRAKLYATDLSTYLNSVALGVTGRTVAFFILALLSSDCYHSEIVLLKYSIQYR